MPRAAIYARVSLPTRHISTQLYELRELAAKRGLEVVGEYQDLGNSGTKARRPGLDALMADARHKKFSGRAGGRIRPHCQKHPPFPPNPGRAWQPWRRVHLCQGVHRHHRADRAALSTLVGCIGGLEGALIRERIRQGMARRRLEGFRLGRAPLNVDHDAIVHDRLSGMSLTADGRAHHVSRASVVRFVRDARLRSRAGRAVSADAAKAACRVDGVRGEQ